VMKLAWKAMLARKSNAAMRSAWGMRRL
jgi:hypothetical protein